MTFPFFCPPLSLPLPRLDLFLLIRVMFARVAVSDPDAAADDENCMARMADGDTQALRPIFDRWKIPLISYFYRALASRADAEDLTLQVFERVYRAAPKYRSEARFSSWLFSIARRELLHELRRRRRKPAEPVDPNELRVANSADAHDLILLRETEEALLEALKHLPERQRSAIVLAAAGDLSHAQIAGALGVTENNLNVILHRARLALKKHFNPGIP